MKIRTDTVRYTDVRIERIEANVTWLRDGQALVGFSTRQLRDAELVVARVLVIAHVEFLIPDDVDVEEWWATVLEELHAEYAESKREAKVPKARAARVKVRAGDLDEKES